MTTRRYEGSLTLVDMGATYTNGRGDLTVGRNATVAGTLAMTGAVTLSSTLAVTGAATLSSTLAVTGAATLSSTLGVAGILSATSGTASTSSTTGALVVTGGVGISGAVNVVGLLSTQGGLIESYNNNSQTGTVTLTTANIINGLVISNGASYTGTTPTAAQLVTAIPGAIVGSSFKFWVRNIHATGVFTLGAGSGVTLATGNTNTVAAVSTKLFIGYFTNVTAAAEAITIYSMGLAVH